jgi:hypothetical protein
MVNPANQAILQYTTAHFVYKTHVTDAVTQEKVQPQMCIQPRQSGALKETAASGSDKQ